MYNFVANLCGNFEQSYSQNDFDLQPLVNLTWVKVTQNLID